MNILFRKHLFYVRVVDIKIDAKTKIILIVTFCCTVLLQKEQTSGGNLKKKKCSVYENYIVTERICQKWFTKFCSGDFNINDAPCSGRPSKIDSSDVKAIANTNPSKTVQESATGLNIFHTIVTIFAN